MPAPRILFVKLSSLGDVIHHMPAVTDLRAHLPGAHVAWAVEEAYAGLVSMHPGVHEAVAVALRGLRSHPLRPSRWRALFRSKAALAAGRWDYVVDTQGLLKSALVARAAGRPAFGPDRASAREKLASRFYDVRIPVARGLHAVERNRLLVADVFGYRVEGPPRYGLQAPAQAPPWAPVGPYAVFLHAASRAAKQWPADRWIELGRRLAANGMAIVVPGGTAAEREAASRLAASVPGGVAAPAMSLPEAAALLGHAWMVAGVDTGLTHLAVALGRPTIGIYCATRPALTGLHGANAVNVGAPRDVPSVDDVLRHVALRPGA